jgi:hypothetical protein
MALLAFSEPGRARSIAGVEKKSILRLLALRTRHENLLDDPQALLYCEPEFDRQFVLSSS